MKISKETLAAARKAANAQGMSLDTWADKVLAAAAASNQSSDVVALLREISAKIDQISNQQSLAERANEQLAATIQEVGKSYAVVRRTTGQFLGDVATRTSSAIDEVREKTRELIGQVNWPATDAAEKPVAANEIKGAEPSAEPPPAKRRRSIRKPAAKPRRGGTRPKRTANRGTARS